MLSLLLRRLGIVSDFGITIIGIGTLIVSSTYIFETAEISIALALPFLAILTFSRVGSGFYINFFLYLSFFLEVADKNIKQIQLRKKRILLSLGISAASLTITYFSLIFYYKLDSALAFSLTFVVYLIAMLYSNAKNKFFTIVKKLVIYCIAATLSFTSFVLTQLDSGDNFTISFFITLFTLLFSIDRIFALSKDSKELIKDESLYYYYSNDLLPAEELNNKIIPLNLITGYSNDSTLTTPPRVIAQQAILRYRLGYLDELRKIIDYSDGIEPSLYNKVFLYFDAVLYSIENFQIGTHPTRHVINQYKKKLQEAIDFNDRTFEPVELYKEYAFILLLDDSATKEVLIQSKDILENHIIFLTHEEKIILEELNQAIKDFE